MAMKHAFCLWLLLAAAVFASGDAAAVPGDVNSLCYYDNFFYNLPEGDFFYYFNDALLYTEPPDDTVYENRMRDRYLRLVRRHRQIKEFILAKGNPQNRTIAIDLRSEAGFAEAKEFMALLGLVLSKGTAGTLAVKAADEESPIQYYAFIGLKAGVLQEQLQRTSVFFFKLQETEVRLPWDFSFLSAITSLKLEADSFFEQIIANKRLSLLLAALFRLSDKEIGLVGGGAPGASAPAWRRIYLDKRMLMGMLVLSTALRESDGRLLLPGGGKAGAFWAALAGVDPVGAPGEFITKLCCLDEGKLNYLYVLSFFLPEEARRALFFDYDPVKVGRLYRRIVLGANERIRAKAFPRLEDFSYYSLLYLLNAADGRIKLPLGVEAWARAMGMELPAGADECDFLEGLLAASRAPGRKMTPLRKFMTLYAKFADRRLLLTPEFLEKAFGRCESHSVLMDYIERIPLKSPESVDALISWLDRIQGLDREERQLYTALAQSLLEATAHAAIYSPGTIDFDGIVRDLAVFPLKRAGFYDSLFALLARLSGADSPRLLSDDALTGFVFNGLNNQEVPIRGDAYLWRVRDKAAGDLQEMMRSQEACSLANLAEINGILEDLADEPGVASSRARRLREACEQLPYPDFSSAAPRSLKERVIAYDREDLAGDVSDLLKKCEKKEPREQVGAAIAAFKSRYLLPLAKDYFLALAYALNAKSPDLRIFINPNLARLHDFSDSEASPWEAGCAPGHKTEFSGYYLRGGLSRLGLAFAVNWRSQLFQKNIFSLEQAHSVITNIMAMLPQPLAVHSATPDALLVELAVEMLTRSREDETIRAIVWDASLSLVAGYHHRRLSDYLDGTASDYHLFASELRELGARLADLDAPRVIFSRQEELIAFRHPPQSTLVAAESDAWGNVLFNSFGSLAPRSCAYVPQEAAQLFGSGWLSGETTREFKVKTASLADRIGLPQLLAGQFILDFIGTVGRSVYAQNHVKDYHSTFFVLDIMNSGHLRKTLKKLQSDGYVRLR